MQAGAVHCRMPPMAPGIRRRARQQARSAVTAACVAGGPARRSVETGAGGAGFQRQRSLATRAHHLERGFRDAPAQPRRLRPAAASRMRRTARIELAQARVEIARTDSTVRSGRSWRSCAARRKELVRPVRRRAIGERGPTTRRAVSRWGTAASTRPAGSSVGRPSGCARRDRAAVEQGFLKISW